MGVLDETYSTLCMCRAYEFWFHDDDDTAICECGHPEWEHADMIGSCTGEVAEHD